LDLMLTAEREHERGDGIHGAGGDGDVLRERARASQEERDDRSRRERQEEDDEG